MRGVTYIYVDNVAHLSVGLYTKPPLRFLSVLSIALTVPLNPEKHGLSEEEHTCLLGLGTFGPLGEEIQGPRYPGP